MNPVRSIRNQYRGINAHLHSLWQAEGGWNSFHRRHIGDLAGILRGLLLPLGYDADIEQALQIRRLDKPITRPESDVTIYDLNRERAYQPPVQTMASTAELVMPLQAALLTQEELSEKDLGAIQIRRYTSGSGISGDPVAWIELLSPSNKPGGQDALAYQEKRLRILESGLVVVELDYLHQSAPALKNVPIYRARGGQALDIAAHPYRIVVYEPRPDFLSGQVRSREFDVDQLLPTVNIPLSGSDVLAFDFGVPYRKTFEEMYYGLRFVDYTQFPLNFDRYSEVDQARIVARMLAVLKAARAGMDLEADTPLEVEAITLEAGLAELERWKQKS
ncbi:MAG: DUF4058 family protein [bacterium]|nr:DUF4058 family protein [bacterium]